MLRNVVLVSELQYRDAKFAREAKCYLPGEALIGRGAASPRFVLD